MQAGSAVITLAWASGPLGHGACHAQLSEAGRLPWAQPLVLGQARLVLRDLTPGRNLSLSVLCQAGLLRAATHPVVLPVGTWLCVGGGCRSPGGRPEAKPQRCLRRAEPLPLLLGASPPLQPVLLQRGARGQRGCRVSEGPAPHPFAPAPASWGVLTPTQRGTSDSRRARPRGGCAVSARGHWHGPDLDGARGGCGQQLAVGGRAHLVFQASTSGDALLLPSLLPATSYRLGLTVLGRNGLRSRGVTLLCTTSAEGERFRGLQSRPCPYPSTAHWGVAPLCPQALLWP